MINKGKNILKELRDYFSGKKSETGEYIYNKWFDSFDDSEGPADNLTRQERDQHRQKVFVSLERELRLSRIKSFKPHYSKCQRWNPFYKVAAILILGGLLSLTAGYKTGSFEQEPEPVSMIEKYNPHGQITEFLLPDGSKVWLNAESTLTFPEQFPETDRAVTLSGEAFFEVVTDSTHPFIVDSGPLSTRVLGTSFNVKAYQEDPGIEVTLNTGEIEVSVDGGSQKQTLSPNQQVRYEKESGLINVQNVDASLMKVWIHQELVFLRESFETIARTFERWYGVEFVFEDDALKDETFVYHFEKLSLENSMIILNRMADFDYEIHDNKITIRKTPE